MRNSYFTLLLALTASCTGASTPQIELPPNGGLPEQGQVPTSVFSFGGSFTFTGPTAPGSASFVAAPISDPDQPANEGTGSYNVTLDGTNFSGALGSMAFVIDDGTEYLVIGGYRLYDQAPKELLEQVVVIVKASDFAPNGTVALDGIDRVALFGFGEASAEEPEVVGAAISGTVTFGAGSLAVGDTINASVQGDFGPIQLDPGPAPTGNIAPGNYTASVDAISKAVYCDGTLAGQESAFAGVTAASLGLTGGAVSISGIQPDGSITVAGPGVAGVGASTLSLTDYDGGIWAAIVDTSSPGPANTTLAGRFFVLDANTATPTTVDGSIGVGYVTASDDGSCSVVFPTSLTQ